MIGFINSYKERVVIIELYENQMGRWWSSEATASLGLLTPQIQLKLRVLKVSKAALPRVGSSELVE